MGFLLKKFGVEGKNQTIANLHGKLKRVMATFTSSRSASVLYQLSKKPILLQDFARLRLFI